MLFENDDDGDDVDETAEAFLHCSLARLISHSLENCMLVCVSGDSVKSMRTQTNRSQAFSQTFKTS